MSLSQRLAALSASYVRQLRERTGELASTFDAILNDPGDAAARERLMLIAHKIAGSGATFGFDRISAAGRRVEEAAASILDPGTEYGAEALQRALGEPVEALEAICADEISVAAGNRRNAVSDVTDTDEGSPRKLVIAAAEQSDEITELGEQLGFFGYQVSHIDTVESLRAFGEAEPGALAIIHTNFESGVASCGGELKKLQADLGGAFPFVFVSDRSDFNTRLAALRAAGEAYFLLPVDIARMLDTIEYHAGEFEDEPYHVLIVDDDPEQVSYYALIFQQAGMITSVASDPRTVLNILSEAKPELILMDMFMPGCTGTELLALIRQQEAFVGIPVVFLSIEGDEERKLRAIEFGADDFITKPVDPDYLAASIANRVARTRSIRYFMERDSLTGLLNHTNLREQLVREIMRAKRTSQKLCFGMIDLDHFKSVNDTHGHLIGDKVLKGLSKILQERLRRTDLIGRHGGEEFGVVMLNSCLEDAVRILDEIRRNFGKIRHTAESTAFSVTFSCGVASIEDYRDVDSITQAADDALYRAKESGRNCVMSAPPASPDSVAP